MCICMHAHGKLGKVRKQMRRPHPNLLNHVSFKFNNWYQTCQLRIFFFTFLLHPTTYISITYLAKFLRSLINSFDPSASSLYIHSYIRMNKRSKPLIEKKVSPVLPNLRGGKIEDTIYLYYWNLEYSIQQIMIKLVNNNFFCFVFWKW